VLTVTVIRENMKKVKSRTILVTFFLIILISCGRNQTIDFLEEGGLRQQCYKDGTCDDELTCVSNVCVNLNELEDEDSEDSELDIYSDLDNEFLDSGTVDNDIASAENCNDLSIGMNCTRDIDCGTCNICSQGKCRRGCLSDDDCKMYVGVRCNKKLYRCTNIYASLQACGEVKCPTGCCYALKGLTGVNCLTTPDATKCGVCLNGQVYIPEQLKCVPATCSTTSDNCPELNSEEEFSDFYECKAGEFICKENPYGESVLKIIEAAQCIAAGQRCVPGVSECCSGMPCVEGYCY